MTSHRATALLAAAHAAPHVATEAVPASALFGSLSLRPFQIIEALGAKDGAVFQSFVAGKGRLDANLANRVGEIVTAWALKHGATHYAHWFHPLTGLPAEKHDAFLTRTSAAPNTPVEKLSGALLLQSEPDASSFPSGGVRATHTARGYSVWDPSSAIFIRVDAGARTMCIPAVYVSWLGHALDSKAPLLRAMEAVSREVSAYINVVNGNDSCTGIVVSLGLEQEYFLVDKGLAALRPDLLAAGRTLLGCSPARGQQLEDHYFGVIPSRVQAFMADAEQELFRFGVPVKTQHAEVAPAQFETAPIFEEMNVAVDHNVLTMETLRRVADRHGLLCLFHEKPFAGVNGSGKHNNWSLGTADGTNLLEPSSAPHDNVPFLATLAVVLTAMDKHNDIVRAGIASAGNEHRLGANEAPPAILSVYLGSALDHVISGIAAGEVRTVEQIADIHITGNLSAKPDLTDRNRTTPFAFTGNKFEFRAVGASENCGWPMTLLNAAVADAARILRARIEARVEAVVGDRAAAILSVVREVFQETTRVRFEGNNYSDEWRDEAARRGLGNHATTPAALAVLGDHERTAFLTELGVLSSEEIHARHEIHLEKYAKQLQIEAVALAEIVATQIAPAALIQMTRLGAGRACLAQGQGASRIGRDLEKLGIRYEALLNSIDELRAVGDAVGLDPAAVAERLRPAMAAVREEADALEQLVADDLWPLPKYREMLFVGV